MEEEIEQKVEEEYEIKEETVVDEAEEDQEEGEEEKEGKREDKEEEKEEEETETESDIFSHYFEGFLIQPITAPTKRCQRRRKSKKVSTQSGIFEKEEFEPNAYEGSDEEGEIEESILGEEEYIIRKFLKAEDSDEEIERKSESVTSSVLSAISFEWENVKYEFEELCDPGTIENIYKRYYGVYTQYDDIGRVRYMQVCKMLSATPILRFYTGLTAAEIDLSFRAIDSNNIRAMCAALQNNSYVEKLHLCFNKLTVDDCYYIGLMLMSNDILNTLDLTGCRVGPQGVEKIVEGIPKNTTLEELNLSKCNILDEGMKLLCNVLIMNMYIEKLDVSYNKLEEESAEALGLMLKFNRTLKHLNLRYNNLFDPTAMKQFFKGMIVNDSVTHLNLSWNGLSGVETAKNISLFLKKNFVILFLDLSDNRFAGLAVLELKKGLAWSKSLETFKIGKNPLSIEDIGKILLGAKACSTLRLLDLEDLWIDKSQKKDVLKMQNTRDLEINYAGILSDYEVKGPDYAVVLFKRIQYEAMKPKSKKMRKDFGHFIWNLGEDPMTEEEFMTRVKKFKAKVNKSMYPDLMKEFEDSTKLINVVAMKEKYLSIFPDSTPPPPPKVKPKKKGKGKKKEKETVEEEKIEGSEGGEESLELYEGSLYDEEEESGEFGEEDEDEDKEESFEIEMGSEHSLEEEEGEEESSEGEEEEEDEEEEEENEEDFKSPEKDVVLEEND